MKKNSLTTEHPSSSYGIPVFLDAEGRPMDYADGVRQIRRSFGWSVSDLAERCGVSPRTVEGWEQGRPVSTPALLLMQQLLE